MWKKVRNHLPDVDSDDVLEVLGLESRRSTSEKLLPSVALFGAGLLVGVGLGLMLAPKPGNELRSDLKQRLNRKNGSGGELSTTQASVEKAS